MKEGRRLGGVHAGPESKVLDGLSWEEVKNMQDAQTSQVDGYGTMKIGAASKGIIQRDFQHHATVFKSPYAKNPFDSVSNDELEEYKRIIDKKQRGETSPIAEDPGDTTDPGKQDPAPPTECLATGWSSLSLPALTLLLPCAQRSLTKVFLPPNTISQV